MRWFLTLVLAAGISAAVADPIALPATITLRDKDPATEKPVVYSEVVYQVHDGAFLSFTHRDGIARVKIASLPADVQKLLNYNPEAEQNALEIEQNRRQHVAAVQSMEREKQKFAAALADYKKLEMIVQYRAISVTAEGLLAQTTGDDSQTIFIYGATGYDGERYEGSVWPCGAYNYTSVLGASKRVRAFASRPEIGIKVLAASSQ